MQNPNAEFLWDFEAKEPDVLVHTQVFAPPQMVGGKRVELEVTSDKLIVPSEPPSKEGFSKKPMYVIELAVHAKGDSTPIYKFDPPLIITMEYGKRPIGAEQKALQHEEIPSIFTCWYGGGKWRWEKQKTSRADLNGAPAIRAEISTLHPDDPQGYD